MLPSRDTVRNDIEAEVIDYQGIGSEPGNCNGMRLGETQRHGACHIYPVDGMRLMSLID